MTGGGIALVFDFYKTVWKLRLMDAAETTFYRMFLEVHIVQVI